MLNKIRTIALSAIALGLTATIAPVTASALNNTNCSLYSIEASPSGNSEITFIGEAASNPTKIVLVRTNGKENRAVYFTPTDNYPAYNFGPWFFSIAKIGESEFEQAVNVKYPSYKRYRYTFTCAN